MKNNNVNDQVNPFSNKKAFFHHLIFTSLLETFTLFRFCYLQNESIISPFFLFLSLVFFHRINRKKERVQTRPWVCNTDTKLSQTKEETADFLLNEGGENLADSATGWWISFLLGKMTDSILYCAWTLESFRYRAIQKNIITVFALRFHS